MADEEKKPKPKPDKGRVPYNPRVVPDEELGWDPKDDVVAIVMHYTRGYPLGESLKTNMDRWMDLVPIPAVVISIIAYAIGFAVLFTRTL